MLCCSTWKMAAVVENKNMFFCIGVPCLLHNVDSDDEEIICSSKNMKMHSAASPGDDVWKKFGLPPTPPRSPTKSLGEINQNRSTVAERLQLVSESLDDEGSDISDCIPHFDSLSLRSKLIQDCMWNGTVSERGATGDHWNDSLFWLFLLPQNWNSTPSL